MGDLSLLLLEDILEELKKRYDSFIFAYSNRSTNKEDDIFFQFHGGKLSCAGLAEAFKIKLMQDITSDFEEEDEKELSE